MFQNALFNVVAVVADGEILGFVAKRFLAGDGIHYEPRWFKPWPQQVRGSIYLLGRTFPIGDILFQCGDVRIGLEICEDAWVAARPGATLALQGVDIILNPSASHFAFGKIRVRERFVLEGSRAFNASYVYSNLLGNESGRAIYDGGALIASGGALLAQGPRFSFRDVVVTSAVIDVDATRMNQARTASYRPEITNAPLDLVRADFAWPQVETRVGAGVACAAWETSDALKEEEFTRAVTLALFDYLRKSHSHGFVVSLSGGADSSAVSCLVAQTAELAFRELGADGMKRKLGFIPGIDDWNSPRQLIERPAHLRLSGQCQQLATTRNAACELAHAVGADVSRIRHRLPRRRIHANGRARGSGASSTGKTDDLALQNIQARVRSPGIWMVANLQNALLLPPPPAPPTSNALGGGPSATPRWMATPAVV